MGVGQLLFASQPPNTSHNEDLCLPDSDGEQRLLCTDQFSQSTWFPHRLLGLPSLLWSPPWCLRRPANSIHCRDCVPLYLPPEDSPGCPENIPQLCHRPWIQNSWIPLLEHSCSYHYA